MISSLKLKNFKSHKETTINTTKLTVLCGQNGVGKSSIVQALLLLRQTHQKGRLNDVLDLNSPLCFLGKSKDVIYQFAEGKTEVEIEIILQDVTQKTYTWRFNTPRESSYLRRSNNVSESSDYEQLSVFTDKFQYISAARNSNYVEDDYAVEIQQQLSISEGKGELTAHFLSFYGKQIKVENQLLHPSERDNTLISQVTAWEREVSQGVIVKPNPVGQGYEINYSFINDALGETDDFKARNVGFGLPYVLPIIVAVLSAKPGSLLLVENPEAHLHPAAQSKLAELLCLAAESGIQIIIETHSDHIINGILIQCKAFEETRRGLDRANLKIYSFARIDATHETNSTEVTVLPKGKIQTRPNGFFDQFGKDVRTLL